MRPSNEGLTERPVLEIHEEFFYREYRDIKTKQVVQREYIHQIAWTTVKAQWSSFVMSVKALIAFKLLKGVGDPCPYCDHIIDIGNWSKMFADASPVKERDAKIESLERMVEDLNQRLKGQIHHNNQLAERLATSQPRNAPMLDL